MDSKHGLNLYDYSARYYEPAIGRFTTMDPLAEKYYSVSPYAYVSNNPMRFIDPDGTDEWEVNKNSGEISWVKSSTEHTLHALDAKGERTGDFLAVENADILAGLRIKREHKNRKKNHYGHYVVTSSSEVARIFLFLADHTDVEWGLEGQNVDGNISYILTTSNKGPSVTMRKPRFIEGFKIENATFLMHSHPGVNGTRGASIVTNVYDDMDQIKEYHNELGNNLPVHYIYHPYSKNVYEYTPENPSIYRSTIKNYNGLNFLTKPAPSENSSFRRREIIQKSRK